MQDKVRSTDSAQPPKNSRPSQQINSDPWDLQPTDWEPFF